MAWQNAYVKCPFCGEDNFDLYGLKIHLLRFYCEDFNNVEVPPELSRPLELKV